MTDVALTGAGWLLGSLGAFLVWKNGARLGWIDRPSGRSSHARPTAKGGGIGILAAFCLAGSLAGILPQLWLPVAALSLASLVGDRRDLPAALRLALQFAAAAAACWQLARVTPDLAFLRPAGFAPGVALAAVFVVATANVYNFMDGINGIAAISGLVAFALLAVSGWLRGEPSSWVLLAAVLAAACAGFLPFNFPRARVFMGDVGSVLLGFAFALFAVAWSRDLADLVMFGLFLFPFYADELVSLPPRLRSGDSLTRPHRRHVYQILVNQMARPHWQIAILYAIVQAAVALTALAIRPLGWAAEASWLGLALAAAWMAATRVRRREN